MRDFFKDFLKRIVIGGLFATGLLCLAATVYGVAGVIMGEFPLYYPFVSCVAVVALFSAAATIIDYWD